MGILKSCCRLLLIVLPVYATAQQNVHPQSTDYQWPTDAAVKEKLDKWQDLKFGIILHWGLYSVPGMIESWALCSEDWITRDSNSHYEDFKSWYWGLKKDFNPTKFNPESWAKAAKDAGMKYVVFTTKHHDGFCMWDTKETSFNIADGPFKSNPKADAAKYVFDAFRQQDFMIGAYFSKPDWHSENFWWPLYATPDRNANYDIRKFPWRWNAFKQYTYNQIGELMHNYGSMDILWLDGGWVRPRESVTDEVRSWGAKIPEWNQEVDIPRIAAMAREAQPGLLVVDRTVHGPYENYQTPEQRIPATQLDHPWESCMTLGNNWGYIPGEQMKPATQVIHTLIEVVAKGGSLLLGVGPKPDGTLSDTVVQRLEEIGQWMQKNGDALYNTRSTKMYRDSTTYFTQSKNGSTRYALVCLEDGKPVPTSVSWQGNAPKKGTKMKWLQTGATVKWKQQAGKTIVTVPATAKTAALAFAFTPADSL